MNVVFYVRVTRKKLPKRRSYEKFARKTLMKLAPGFNFSTNKMSIFFAGWQKIMKLQNLTLKFETHTFIRCILL